ncbi:lytic transglycosylase domain-containing protein, partial [Candidatus Symbiopectobacterium sp. NZEC127]|nr:lytic transglycosylase domain-containing protein [Candidatus Symbiopectobacterium sp. NZEC127]
MGWPQITWLVVTSLVLGINLMQHGKLRTDRHNFWGKLFDALVTAGVLWAGGFFGQAHAAQPP